MQKTLTDLFSFYNRILLLLLFYEAKRCHINFATRTGKKIKLFLLEKYFVLSENGVRYVICNVQNKIIDI